MTRWKHKFAGSVFFGGVFLLIASCADEHDHRTSFTPLPANVTNIDFENTLNQTAAFNIIEYLYFYNGGGVSVGDINNDGLEDIFFTANQLQNRLYLNRGNFAFEDITDGAGVAGAGNWKTGTTMADVNGDGYLDIYVCGVGNYKEFNSRNQLFINNGDLTFTDQTEAYGLSFQGFSTHASFFDYDNDGDLDLYLLNHSVHTARSYGHSRLRMQSDPFAGDRLYRNELVPSGKPHFAEVTSRAGIYKSQIAYGLGVGVSDLNVDGFMDIYVSNDFHENDYLYINRGDGTFTETLATSVPHASRFSMGNDIADINNDGLPDIVTLDMLPKDEAVIKTTAGEEPYDIYQFKLGFGYHHQFLRNTLQLNRGVARDGQLRFSDIAALSGVEATDWSWAPLLADFDNDGRKDLFVANGIVTRPNDLDYINFISSDSAQRYFDYEAFIANMPSGKVPNFFYRNAGDLRFEDVSEGWIGGEPTLSTGAAYGDLDNDGDLDLVINNVNAPASIYRNDMTDKPSRWLQVELAGQSPNTFGIGARVVVYASGQTIAREQVLSRGWQSSVSPILHIGLPGAHIDSLCVIWPDKRFEIHRSIHSDQRIHLSQKDARGVWDYTRQREVQPLLTAENLDEFVHRENAFSAFNSEKLIPHMVSTQGPALSTGDVNGDGLDDFHVGGATGQSGKIFLQHADGGFSPTAQPALERDSLAEDIASAFFDADGNGTLDLVVVGGGQQYTGPHKGLQPRLYFNDGQGRMTRSDGSMPEVFLHASCVEVSDIDGDGDADLFVGGRVVPGRYGVNPNSYLFINDGSGQFTDASFRLTSAGGKLGMVTDAEWDDINGDARPDLVVAGEWMPVTILIQGADGVFANRTAAFGLDQTSGWWNTITMADFDGDGDADIAGGNLGLNSRLRAAADRPVQLYAGDIDDNGGMEHLVTYYNGGVPYPFISRDQLVKQVPAFKRAFLKYNTFRHVKRENIFPAKDTLKYFVKEARQFASLYFENAGGTFIPRPLPVEAQAFPIHGFCARDLNNDGLTDLLAVGNLFAVQPALGRYDAGYGLALLGDGKGGFRSLTYAASGFFVEGEGRRIEALASPEGTWRFIVARNDAGLLLFR